VLLYAVVAVWTAATLAGWAAARLEGDGRRLLRAAAAATILAAVLVWPVAGALALPKFLWGWVHITHKVEDGLLEGAAFLRQNSRPGDTFATSGVKAGWVATDSAAQLESLTGMPAYLARPFTQMNRSDARGREATRRYFALGRVAAEKDFPSAIRRMRELGIVWYVHVGGVPPTWDPARGHAVFVERDVAVYSTRAAP
jgi:hypothetical protein